jgi:hypothetical protein
MYAVGPSLLPSRSLFQPISRCQSLKLEQRQQFSEKIRPASAFLSLPTVLHIHLHEAGLAGVSTPTTTRLSAQP